METTAATTKKRKVKEEDEDEQPKEEHQEEQEEEEETTSPPLQRTEEGDAFFELSSKRRCTVRKWKSNVLIDIREVRKRRELNGSKSSGCSIALCCIVFVATVVGTTVQCVGSSLWMMIASPARIIYIILIENR